MTGVQTCALPILLLTAAPISSSACRQEIGCHFPEPRAPARLRGCINRSPSDNCSQDEASAALTRPLLRLDSVTPETSTTCLPGLLPVLLTAMSLECITYRTQRRVFRLGFDSVVLLLVYAAGMAVIVME